MGKNIFLKLLIFFPSEFCFYTGGNLFRVAKISNTSALLFDVTVFIMLKVLNMQVVLRLFTISG